MRALVADCREMLAEQVEYRELLLQMTIRDLMLRYKQTVMGFGWAIFMPIVNTVIFAVIFTRVAPIDTPVPYVLFAYCGLLVWNFLASALRFSVTSLTANANMVTKVYFPREVFPFSAVAVCAVDLGVGALVLAALMAYYKVVPTVEIFWLPVVFAVQLMFTTGVALLVAMANLFYRDVKYLFEVAITMWMFATPVVYPVSGLTGSLGTVISLNPMTPVVDAYRNILLLGSPPPATLAWSGALSLVTLAGAWIWFHRAEFSFAENV